MLEPDPDNGIPRRSYITTLTVSNVPESYMEFGESSAWGKVLRDLPYPVEVSWRFALMSEKAWQKYAKKKIGHLRDEALNRNQAANNPPDAPTGDLKFDRTWDAAEELYAQLQLEPKPVMIGQLRLVVAAPSLDALSDAVREVKNSWPCSRSSCPVQSTSRASASSTCPRRPVGSTSVNGGAAWRRWPCPGWTAPRPWETGPSSLEG